jgi:hypothetical protein
MTNIKTPNNAGKEDLTRVDPFREDEDTGGDAAPPLRPRTPGAQKPDLPPAQP